MTVAEALNTYATEHAPGVSDPARIGYAIEALVPFWGERPLSTITRETCKAYGRTRRKVVRRDPKTKEVLETAPVAPSTIRKELGTLAAAINYCKDEGYVVNPPKVHLPEKTEPKDRWLTRNEAARLLWAAWRNPDSRHLARFILIALYTGTRKTAILRLRFMPNTSGGWVDTERGQMYRRGQGETETKKKRPPDPPTSPARSPPASMGTWSKPLGNRVQRCRGRINQNRLENGCCRGRAFRDWRYTSHPAPHGDHLGDAGGGGRHMGNRRLLWRQHRNHAPCLCAPPSRSSGQHCEGDGKGRAETVRPHKFSTESRFEGRTKQATNRDQKENINA